MRLDDDAPLRDRVAECDVEFASNSNVQRRPFAASRGRIGFLTSLVLGMCLGATAFIVPLPLVSGQDIGGPGPCVEAENTAALCRDAAVIIVGLSPGTPLRADYEAVVGEPPSDAALAHLTERLAAIAGVPLGRVTPRSGGDVTAEIDTKALERDLLNRLNSLDGVESASSIAPEAPYVHPQVLVRLQPGAELDHAALAGLAPTSRHSVDDGRLIVSLDMATLVQQVIERLTGAHGIAYAQPVYTVGIY